MPRSPTDECVANCIPAAGVFRAVRVEVGNLKLTGMGAVSGHELVAVARLKRYDPRGIV